MSKELRDFLSAERGRAVGLARALGVSRTTVHEWACGKKSIPLDRAAPIERATGGCVRRWCLRPDDWAAHWPELVGTLGAPEVDEVRRAA